MSGVLFPPATSRNGVAIRLTPERWEHIIRNHPEMEDQSLKVFQTVGEPDRVLEGDFGELLAVRFYEETPLTPKFLIVPYREMTQTDGFALTAYFTGKFSEKRRVVWTR